MMCGLRNVVKNTWIGVFPDLFIDLVRGYKARTNRMAFAVIEHMAKFDTLD